MELAMSDFEMTEFERWETGADNDAHLLLRETPAWKTREQWAQIQLLIHQQTLEKDLAVAHITENLDQTLADEYFGTIKPVSVSWLQQKFDRMQVYICRFIHRTPKYRRGDQHSICPVCRRMYAIPWADMSKVGNNVYVPSEPFITPTEHIRQVVCRSGIQGEV